MFTRSDWSKEDLEIMRLWLSENENTLVRERNIPNTLKEIFPSRSDGAIYQRLRLIRIGGGKQCRRLSPRRASSYPLKTEQFLKDWIQKHPMERVSYAHGHPDLNFLFEGRSMAALYNKWRARRESLGMPMLPEKGDGRTTTFEINSPPPGRPFVESNHDIIGRIERVQAAAILDVFNEELEKRIKNITNKHTIEIANISEKYIANIESQKEEITTLKAQLRDTADIRVAVEKFQKTHYPAHR